MYRISCQLFLLILVSMLSLTLRADEADDMAAYQAQLNAQVMEKPFSVEDEAKIDQYVKSAMQKDLKPDVSSKPQNWRPGYTCADVYHVSWRTYRNCRYYHRYYGRYW